MTDQPNPLDDIQKQVEEIANEAQASFDLGDFIRGRAAITKTIKLYTDEDAGAELGGYAVERDLLGRSTVRSWGLKGEAYELVTERDNLQTEIDARAAVAVGADKKPTAAEKKRLAEITKRLKELDTEAEPIRARLEASSLTFELRSVPNVIKKDAHRAARKELDISGKGIPADREEEFNDEYEAQLFSNVIVKTTRGDGADGGSMTVDAARNLRRFLPEEEYARLSSEVIELLFKAKISKDAVENADF